MTRTGKSDTCEHTALQGARGGAQVPSAEAAGGGWRAAVGEGAGAAAGGAVGAGAGGVGTEARGGGLVVGEGDSWKPEG